VNPKQLDQYIENGGFFVEHIPDGSNYYKPWNMGYQNWAVDMGLFDAPSPYLFQLYVEPMRKFQLAAEGHGDRQPPDHLRARIKETLDPLPIWYSNEADNLADEYPITALTQRPMAMYHSWGSQNAWLRQLHGHNPLYLPTKLMAMHDLKDGDWAKVTSPHGEITVPVLHMAALNENTITGQAAWFDLKVKIEKSYAPAESQPSMPAIKSPVGKGPQELKWKLGK